jgi:hypothetical protein
MRSLSFRAPRIARLLRAPRIAAAASLLALSAAPHDRDARAGAWVPPPGGGILKLSLLTQRASERVDCDGRRVPADPSGGDYVDRELFLYGEYGVRSRLALVGSWAFKDQRIDGAPGFGTRSTADLQLGARLALHEGRSPWAAQASLWVPTYPASDLGKPPAQRTQYLPAGSGHVEGELLLLAGRSLWPLPLYANATLGYRGRGAGFADSWLGALEAGASGGAAFWKVELRAVLPAGGGCSGAAAGAVSASERSWRLAPEAALRVCGTLWLVGGASLPLGGENTLRGVQWSLGVATWAPRAEGERR